MSNEIRKLMLMKHKTCAELRLSPTEIKIMSELYFTDIKQTSSLLALKLGMKTHHCSTVLIKLNKKGYLKKERTNNKERKEFVYDVAEFFNE